MSVFFVGGRIAGSLIYVPARTVLVLDEFNLGAGVGLQPPWTIEGDNQATWQHSGTGYMRAIGQANVGINFSAGMSIPEPDRQRGVEIQITGYFFQGIFPEIRLRWPGGLSFTTLRLRTSAGALYRMEQQGTGGNLTYQYPSGTYPAPNGSKWGITLTITKTKISSSGPNQAKLETNNPLGTIPNWAALADTTISSSTTPLEYQYDRALVATL